MLARERRPWAGLVCCVICVLSGQVSLAVPSSKSLPIDIIVGNGYPVELHVNIQTEDGYLLDMHRIPHGLDNANETDKPVVLLMHGMLGSAEHWIVSGADKGLAFIMADAGYDVWLGNARGTTHSRKHKWLDPDYDRAYWDFSWHEIGLYDLPAKINHIVESTGRGGIFYIGHSQGTTSFFVMASERPEFNEKIRLMVCLAPVAYMSNLGNPIVQVMARIGSNFNSILSLVAIGEFFPKSDFMTLAGETLCNEKAIVQEVCTNLLFLLAGYDSTEMNRTALPAILRGSPAGVSTKQLLHYGQEVNSGYFRYFDYGLLRNFIKYSSVSPPSYRLDRISAPIALFYSKNDWLSSVRDVEKLQRELPNVVHSYLVPYERFNHLDFLWASSVVDTVYSKVLDLLTEY